MKFEEIKPFVRCTEQINYNSMVIGKLLMAYDNCIVYVLSGSGTISVNNKQYQMNKGTVLMWRAGTSYHIYPSDDNPVYIIINFDFTSEKCVTNSFKISPESPDIFNSDRIVDSTFFEDCTEFNSTIYVKSARQLEELFLGVVSEFKKPKTHMNMRVSAKMTIIFSELSDTFNLNISVKPSGKSDEIIEYIHENYTENLTNGDIAKYFNFHPQHVNKIIKRKTGYSLHKYVIMRRISKAIDLLETTKMPISEIADKIGFQNLCHFSRYFKEFMGTSPKAYRQKTENYKTRS